MKFTKLRQAQPDLRIRICTGAVVEPRITLKRAMRILSRKVKFDPKKVSAVVITPGGLHPELTTFTWAIYMETPPGADGLPGSVAHFVDSVTGRIIR